MSQHVSIRSMSVLAYAQGFTLWHYKAGAATLADTVENGFFDTASEMLAVGDMIMVSAQDGGRMLVVGGVDTTSALRCVSVAPFT